jgi:hypothetical protein
MRCHLGIGICFSHSPSRRISACLGLRGHRHGNNEKIASPSFEDTPGIPPTRGFGLVTISDKPPPLADYTISDLISLATPWPIEERVAQAEASVPITPNVPIAKPKPKPELKPTTPKLQNNHPG